MPKFTLSKTLLSFNQINTILECHHSDSDSQIINFIFDSRVHIPRPESALFVALKTSKDDGHKYISELIKRGVNHFLVQDESFITDNANFICVEDTMLALQKIAKHWRESFQAPVIGVAGSNGKTIVKEALASITKAAGLSIIKSPRSFNSQIGVAISLLQPQTNLELAIIEAGISQKGEMRNLQEMITPELGIITHLGDAFSLSFENTEDRVRECISLFSTSNKVFISNENKHINIVREYFNGSDHLVEVAISLSGKNALTVDGTEYQILDNDEVSKNNLGLAIAAAHLLEIDAETIQKGIFNWKKPGNRLSLLAGQYNSLIINDSYTSDIEAMQAAIDFSKANSGNKERVAIITALANSTKGEELLNMLWQNGFTKIHTIGNGFPKMDFQNTGEFLEEAHPKWFQNKVVLIKGLRKHGLEKISHWLEEKKTKTVLTINLDALKKNYNSLRSYLKEETRTLVMLKAHAYGSGSNQLARFLEIINPSYIGVAHIDEAIELRNAGVKTPILVLYSDIKDAYTLQTYQLEPVVYSLNYLRQLQELSDLSLKIHIELDTGMHRLGFNLVELEEISELVSNSGHLVQGIMSHLSSADMPDLDAFTQKQISDFKSASYQLEQLLGYNTLKHLCNSMGTKRFPEAHFDMVRLGIGLYGYVIDKTQHIAELSTTIAQIKKVAIGEGVGYGNLEKSDKERQLAIIPIGYADGFDRGLGNGKWNVIVNNIACPTVGNICMDMSMIDVTNVECGIDDKVEVFGERQSVEQMASALDTIPYEIISRISERVKRIYISE